MPLNNQNKNAVDEMRAQARTLYEQHQDAIQAAFVSARNA